MYFSPYTGPNYYVNVPMPYIRQQPIYWGYPQTTNIENWYQPMQVEDRADNMGFKDQGKQPFVINIEDAAEKNRTFRTAMWTGNHLQVVLMSIGVGESIGLEVHPNVDQFLRIEEGQGLVQMGESENNLNFEKRVSEDYAIMVPAGTWHNLTNTGNKPLKLYTIYAPPEHPFGTIQQTKADAMAAEEDHNSSNQTYFGRTPDEWVQYTDFLVRQGLEDVKRGINPTHILQEFILMGVLVGKGYSPETAYETVEEWERTGESKLLQQSKNM
ncbi:cupin domain-containing protein [Cerasibacillus terrae]|uniref:Cupin domain-containing protein n=1 Tax=Cerasibacillus terrae TaxID=2498845 RepID=A0A5C8NSC3_9BACI|nr:cupin domain-containing protein [Cerasibacillus terrae]TXL64057.1 cupin domain-containing protein [Cerasibacillus terrae]